MLASLLLMGAGCSRSHAPVDAAPAPAEIQSWAFAGARASSRVERRVEADGRELLAGRTELEDGARRLNETATLDGRGHLVRAELDATTGSGEIHFALDAAAGTVRVARSGAEPIVWQAPTDAPWVWRTSSSRGGELASTPVAAWVAARATDGVEVVRVVEPERRVSYLVATDQVGVRTERGKTVVLADDGADVDDHFVVEVRLFERAVTLTRIATASAPGA